jgi:hypothetical protein
MTVDPANVGSQGIVGRVKNILLTPQAEFDRIAGEPADVSRLYMGYVLPLAALSAICAFIGLSLVGVMGLRVGIVPGVVGAVVQVIAALVGVYVVAMITNALAPTFGSQQDMGQAQKLVAYSWTAAFVAGVFAIFPPLAILSIVGLYSIALLYIGLPRLMKTPEDKRIGYVATIIIISIVVFIVIGVVAGALRTMTGGVPSYQFGSSAPASQQVEGQVQLPGGGTVDVGDLQRQAAAISEGGGAAIDPMRLQEQLPQSLPGGFSLTSTSSGSAMGTSQAEGVYQSGDAQITLTIVHMGAMGALAGVAQGMNVQQNRQDADGYARTQTIDGRIYTEEVSTSGGYANYGVVGRGVSVSAQGNGVTLDQARAAVDTVGVQRLERQFGS